MQIASSAWSTCSDARSASEYTATDRTPIFRSVRMMRQAITPRLAIRTLSNTLQFRPVADDHLHGGGIIRVAWIVQLRAVADQCDDVHLRTHFHVLSRFGNAVFKSQAAFRGYRHVH